MRWRLIGPYRAGRVTSVTGVPGDPNTFYFGTPGGGIWKTIDAGRTWFPIFDQEHVASIGAIAVAPSNPNLIYAGTGEQIVGKGVYKSADAGRTWQNLGLEETHFISGLLVDPNNPDIVLVSANGDRAPGKNKGIYKTTDGGKTWKQVLFRDERSGAMDISFALDNPRVVYAAFWRSGPGAFGQAAEGGPDGTPQQNGFLYKSEDEGDTWQPVPTQGLPTEPWGRVGVGAAPGNGGRRVYMIIEQGFYRSDDGGQTWQKSTQDPRIVGSFYFSRIFVDPANPDVLYVAQTSMYRSVDGGKTFEAWSGAPSGDDWHVLWMDPKSEGSVSSQMWHAASTPVSGTLREVAERLSSMSVGDTKMIRGSQRMISGVDQGAAISFDAGQTWTSWYNQPTGQFYHVSTDNQFPYWVYAAQQDSGSVAVASFSNNGELTYRDWFSPEAMEFSFIAPDPKNPNLIYNDGWYGSVQRVDRATGTVTPLFVRGQGWRTTNMPPLAWSPDSWGKDGHWLYMGAQKVLRSHDGGVNWQVISEDLTIRPEPPRTAAQQQAQQPPRPPTATIVEMALSPAKANQVWVGTSNGLVQVTRDGGKTWANVTPHDLPQRTLVSSIEASPHDPATAYVVEIGVNDNKPYCFRTRDFGATWQNIGATLPQNEIARVIREDTVRKGLVLAGTESGMWVSFDAGDHWQSLQLNLPTTSMRDLAIHENDLALATYGRSLWILDDLSPLRQAAESAHANAQLLKPAVATRMRWETYQDTPLNRDEPAGENPPEGATIDYVLKSPPESDVTLTVRDAQNNIVRQFSSKPPQTKFPPANAPEYWFEPLPSLTKNAGHNRFQWDLRYETPRALQYSYYGNMTDYIEYTLADHSIPGHTPRYYPQGAMAAPGQYTVELTADGQTQRQPLTLRADPRSTIPPQQISQAVATQRGVEELMARSAELFEPAHALALAAGARKTALTDAHASEDLLKKISDLSKKADEITNGTRDQLGFGSANRELTRIDEVLALSDNAPAQMVREGITKICQDMSARQAQWRDLNITSIAQVNAALQQAGQQPLPVVGVPAAQPCR